MIEDSEIRNVSIWRNPRIYLTTLISLLIGGGGGYLVSNYKFSNRLEESIKKLGLKYIGKIDYDDNVEGYILEGKSLLGLPEDSPAFLSVKKIIENMDQ